MIFVLEYIKNQFSAPNRMLKYALFRFCVIISKGLQSQLLEGLQDEGESKEYQDLFMKR